MIKKLTFGMIAVSIISGAAFATISGDKQSMDKNLILTNIEALSSTQDIVIEYDKACSDGKDICIIDGSKVYDNATPHRW